MVPERRRLEPIDGAERDTKASQVEINANPALSISELVAATFKASCWLH